VAQFSVYYQINTKHLECGQRVQLLNVKPDGASRDQ